MAKRAFRVFVHRNTRGDAAQRYCVAEGGTRYRRLTCHGTKAAAQKAAKRVRRARR
jgi:hypothetical protein